VAVGLAGALALAGCSDSHDDSETTQEPISRCDWAAWGRGADRTFAQLCESRLTSATVGDLEKVWFFNTRDVVTASPAVVGDALFVGDWSGRFYSLDTVDGSENWHIDLEPAPNTYAGQIVSSAAVADVEDVRTVYVGGGRSLYALDADDGDVRWSHEFGTGADDDFTEIESSPLVVDGLVIVGTDVHNASSGEPTGVYAFDAATGEQRWELPTAPTAGDGATASGCGDVWGSVSADTERQLVFFGTGNCNTAPEGWGRFSEALVAADLATGEVRWTYQPHEPNNDDLDFAGAPNLFAAGGRDLVGLGNKDGDYYAVDRDTGKLVWRGDGTAPGETESGTNYSTGGFIGATAVATGVVVGGTAVGPGPYLHAFDAATGAIRWQNQEPAATYSSSAITNDLVFLGGTDFTLRAYTLDSGDVVWEQEMPGVVAGGVAVVGTDVYSPVGIREPGTDATSATSGVTRFSLDTQPVTSSRGAPSTTRGPSTTRSAAPQECVGTPCAVPFNLISPPPGITPVATLLVELDPWQVTFAATGLGPPSGWLRAGSDAASEGATSYALFISESDDNPQGGLLCVLDANLRCETERIPRADTTYNRITLLAVNDTSKLPSPAQGVDRLVTTISFDPLLAPVEAK